MSEKNKEIEEGEEETPNFLDLPDEELGEMPNFPDEEKEESGSEEEENTDKDEEISKESEDESTEEESSVEEESEDSESNKETEEDASSEEEKEEEEEVEAEEESADEEVSAEDQIKELFAPFKANGKMMQVNTVDEIKTLMKMGANYNKKMAGLKPNLKLMKMLENNNLLDESKLSYLIDLDKKNPDAVNKLIKDSGIDPLEVDVKKDTEYKPSTYTVGDNEVELDAVLDDIKESRAFKDTVDIINNKWDESSKEVLLANPEIIKIINEHVDNGIYEQISTIVESEKMLGKLNGLSDIQAYQAVGDSLQAQGLIKNQPKANDKDTETTAEKAKKTEKTKSRKKAASPTKSTPSKGKKTDFNPLALSDEEFDKIAGSKFL